MRFLGQLLSDLKDTDDAPRVCSHPREDGSQKAAANQPRRGTEKPNLIAVWAFDLLRSEK